MIHLLEAFEEIFNKERERGRKLCDGDFSEVTGNDIVTDLFLTHSDIMEKKLIPFFNDNIHDNNLNEYFTIGYSKILNKEKESVLKKIQCENTERFHRPIVETIDLRIQRESSIECFINSKKEEYNLHDIEESYNKNYTYINNKDGSEFIRNNYPMFCLINACYKVYKDNINEKNKFESCCSEIVDRYKAHGIDILTQDVQLSKYNMR